MFPTLCDSGFPRRVVAGGAHGSLTVALVIFFFTWLFTYMYYTSKNWGTIGCLVAAFGSSTLISPCGSLAEDYDKKYKEQIGCAMRLIAVWQTYCRGSRLLQDIGTHNENS